MAPGFDEPDESKEEGQLKTSESDHEFHPTDGGLVAWFVCMTSFCTVGIIFSIINSFGIISEWLIVNYGATKSLSGAIGSATPGFMFFFSFITSAVMDKVGIRPCAVVGGAVCSSSLLVSSFTTGRVSLLVLSHSFLFGLGSALVYTPSLVILGHHFEKRLGLANGIVTLGSGVLTVVLTRILKPLLLDRIGLNNTFRVLSGVSCIITACAMAWRPRQQVKKSDELHHYPTAQPCLTNNVSGVRLFLSSFFNVSIWRSRGFLVWTAACPFAMFGYFVPFVFLPNFIQSKAQSSAMQPSQTLTAGANNTTAGADSKPEASAEADATVLLICISVGSGVSKIVVGKLADSKCIKRIWLQQAAFFILGVSMMLFPLGNHQVLYILLSLLFGICDGAFICLIGPIAFDLVGPSGASQAIGFLLLAIAVPTTTGPLIAGYINDATGRWDVPFYLAGLSPIAASAIMLLMPKT